MKVTITKRRFRNEGPFRHSFCFVLILKKRGLSETIIRTMIRLAKLKRNGIILYEGPIITKPEVYHGDFIPNRPCSNYFVFPMKIIPLCTYD